MKFILLEKIKLIRKIKNEPLSTNSLFEVCRIMCLNEPVDDPLLFKHSVGARSDNILDLGPIVTDNGVSLKIRLSLSEYADLYNIRIIISKSINNDTINYTILFKDVIDAAHIFDMSNNTINISEIVELIKTSLVMTIKNMKRWY